MDSPIVTFRCETYPDDTLTVESLYNEGVVFLEMRDGDSDETLCFNLSPEDALALGAHLIQLAQESGTIAPDVLSSYGLALCEDAFDEMSTTPLGCG